MEPEEISKYFAPLKERLFKDTSLRIQHASEKIKSELKKESEIQFKKEVEVMYKRIIEIIGIFAAILSFVVVNISIISNIPSLNIAEMLALVIATGMILVLFVLCIDYIIKKDNKNFLLFTILIIGFIVLFIISGLLSII